MAAPAAAVLLLLLPLVSAVDQINITAEPGKDIILPCVATEYKPIKTAEWSRTDRNQYVIYVPNQNSDPVVPERRYEGRVDLSNRENGNLSLILRNVTTPDAGLYECHVQGGARRTKRDIKLVSAIRLDVAQPSPAGNMDGNKDGGNKDGNNMYGNSRGHIVAACAVMVFIVSMVVTAVISRMKIKKSSPHDEANGAQMI